LLQLRAALGYEERYRYLIHDRDSIFGKSLDESIKRRGLKVLKSPPRSPMPCGRSSRRPSPPRFRAWRLCASRPSRASFEVELLGIV
jgi:hypothetical protein